MVLLSNNFGFVKLNPMKVLQLIFFPHILDYHLAGFGDIIQLIFYSCNPAGNFIYVNFQFLLEDWFKKLGSNNKWKLKNELGAFLIHVLNTTF